MFRKRSAPEGAFFRYSLPIAASYVEAFPPSSNIWCTAVVGRSFRQQQPTRNAGSHTKALRFLGLFASSGRPQLPGDAGCCDRSVSPFRSYRMNMPLWAPPVRSEEHTSELQSQSNLLFLL